MYNDVFLQKKLDERASHHALRKLQLPGLKVDFCSNDYLGIVKNNLISFSSDESYLSSGSTGSRLLAGNYPLIEETESCIATFHHAEAALLFNSGYDANTGILASVAQKDDVIIYDQLVHASVRDGIRLSLARSFSFFHNDLSHLEKRLQQAAATAKNIFVVTESVFSMDGDICPLADLVFLCKKYDAHLIIDEAHATGVVGDRGEGLAQHLGLEQDIFCRMHSFGKACGCHGAVLLGSARLKEYLVNFARSFIYSTALPPLAVAAIKQSYQLFPEMIRERRQLQLLINQFQDTTISHQKFISTTPVQVVLIPGNDAVKKAATQLQLYNLDIRPILSPTVPIGSERLRIVLHAYNTESQVKLLTDVLSALPQEK